MLLFPEICSPPLWACTLLSQEHTAGSGAHSPLIIAVWRPCLPDFSEKWLGKRTFFWLLVSDVLSQLHETQKKEKAVSLQLSTLTVLCRVAEIAGSESQSVKDFQRLSMWHQVQSHPTLAPTGKCNSARMLVELILLKGNSDFSFPKLRKHCSQLSTTITAYPRQST